MGEYLYQKWLEEEVKDEVRALSLWGINGFLAEFENWLERKGFITAVVEE